MNEWLWIYEGFDPADEGQREALCAVGNGYIATRGAFPESSADDVHYPGTYMAGVFNRLADEVGGREIVNESLVNTPNWLFLRCRPQGAEWFGPGSSQVLDHHLELDLKRGLLTRRSRLQDDDGRVLSVTQRRFVSLRDPHIACLESTFVAENWSGTLEIESALDGTITNAGVDRYQELSGDHLRHLSSDASGPDHVELEVETSDSHIRIAQQCRTRIVGDREHREIERQSVERQRYAAQILVVPVSEGQEVTVEKVVTTFTSRDLGIYEPMAAARHLRAVAADFDHLLSRHVTSWSHAWHRSHIDLSGDVGHTARVLNLHIFHLLQTASKNTAELDAGVPARGLHGEAYRGHIFWDELFIFPFLTFRVPELTRSLLRYRTRRIDRARGAAFLEGFEGAMFPWQSASDGREETQTTHLNPDSGNWLPDASHLQRHINAAIAYNVWQYWQVTGDLEFMRFWGAEVVLEVARYWASAAEYSHALDRYEIKRVMGPDEYHEGYPNRDGPGLDNNAYTNVMAVWCLLRGLDALALLPESREQELREKLGLTVDELSRWEDISHKMRLCFHDDGILSQFEGYGDLEELDWDAYRERYGNIQRLDRILEAEGDTPNRYKLTKQADTVMLFYLFSSEELAEMFDRLEYEFDSEFIARNVSYYEHRTAHGSTLSQMVHAWLHSRLDRKRSWKLFRAALAADINDVQRGTTAEGIHLGAMAGTIDMVQRCYGGIEARSDRLFLNPHLPTELERLAFTIRYRSQHVELDFNHKRVKAHLIAERSTSAPLTLEVRGTVLRLEPGNTIEVPI